MARWLVSTSEWELSRSEPSTTPDIWCPWTKATMLSSWPGTLLKDPSDCYVNLWLQLIHIMMTMNLNLRSRRRRSYCLTRKMPIFSWLSSSCGDSLNPSWRACRNLFYAFWWVFPYLFFSDRGLSWQFWIAYPFPISSSCSFPISFILPISQVVKISQKYKAHRFVLDASNWWHFMLTP